MPPFILGVWVSSVAGGVLVGSFSKVDNGLHTLASYNGEWLRVLEWLLTTEIGVF
jgi:hypothetical protein